jgi:hypothetical protein
MQLTLLAEITRNYTDECVLINVVSTEQRSRRKTH